MYVVFRQLALAAVVAVAASAAAAQPVAPNRLWTPQDSIAVRYIADAEFHDGRIHFSPDRSSFFFRQYHGDLSCDCVVHELQIFSTRAVEEGVRAGVAPAPLRTVTTRSSSSDFFLGRGISDARWDGNDAVTWLGLEPGGGRRLYRLDIAAGLSRPLSPEGRDVFLYAASGGAAAFITTELDPEDPASLYPATPLTSERILSYLSGDQRQRRTFHVARGGGPAHPVGPHLTGSATFMRISPDGRWAVMVLQRAPGPDWSRYDRQPVRGFRFVLVDTATGEARDFLNAPGGGATQEGSRTPYDALWSADSRTVLLVNTALPLSRGPSARSEAHILAFDIAAWRWRSLGRVEPAGAAPARLHRAQVSAACDGHSVEIAHHPIDGSGEPIRTRHRMNVPPPLSCPAPARADALDVRIVQDMNRPPEVVARLGERSIVLTSPDPALAGLPRAEMRTFEWRSRGGEARRAGLLLPTDGRAGPHPLVIQVYRFRPDHFSPDGAFSTAYAGQALAARGFAILYLDHPRREPGRQAEEGPAFVADVDDVVAALAAERLADPARVGLVGFSRGGFFTYYALTHPGRTPIAAAIAADGWTGSYGEYVTGAAESIAGGDVSGWHQQWGAGTFWQSPEAWLAQAPGFNVDKVRAPILFTVNHRRNIELTLETIGAFRINRRPFDFVLLPSGSHQLVRPRERIASMALTIDWFLFWLMGESDPDPAKAEQYRRWTQLRAMER